MVYVNWSSEAVLQNSRYIDFYNQVQNGKLIKNARGKEDKKLPNIDTYSKCLEIPIYAERGCTSIVNYKI